QEAVRYRPAHRADSNARRREARQFVSCVGAPAAPISTTLLTARRLGFPGSLAVFLLGSSQGEGRSAQEISNSDRQKMYAASTFAIRYSTFAIRFFSRRSGVSFVPSSFPLSIPPCHRGFLKSHW